MPIIYRLIRSSAQNEFGSFPQTRPGSRPLVLCKQYPSSRVDRFPRTTISSARCRPSGLRRPRGPAPKGQPGWFRRPRRPSHPGTWPPVLPSRRDLVRLHRDRSHGPPPGVQRNRGHLSLPRVPLARVESWQAVRLSIGC